MVSYLIRLTSMCGSIVHASDDALTGVFAGKIMSKIVVFSLIYFLVMVVPWPMPMVIVAGVPTTTVTMSLFVAVVIIVPLVKSV